MRPERWWSVILTVGLFMALSPLSAQAGPNRPVAPQPHRQAFTPPQPRGHVNTMHSQPHRWQQPRGNAYGWHGQNRQWHQPQGHHYGWNQQRPGHQNYGNHYGWNNHQRPGHQSYGNHYGWNGHQRQWDQHRNAGWNGHQWQGNQHRNAYGRNDHQWQQPPNGGGQHHNPGSYNRADYPGHSQSPNTSTHSSGYPHNTSPAGHTGTQHGFRQHDATGNAPVPDQSTEGVI